MACSPAVPATVTVDLARRTRRGAVARLSALRAADGARRAARGCPRRPRRPDAWRAGCHRSASPSRRRSRPPRRRRGLRGAIGRTVGVPSGAAVSVPTTDRRPAASRGTRGIDAFGLRLARRARTTAPLRAAARRCDRLPRRGAAFRPDAAAPRRRTRRCRRRHSAANSASTARGLGMTSSSGSIVRHRNASARYRSRCPAGSSHTGRRRS